MSATVVEPTLKIGISESIRHNPKWLVDVEKATAYLQTLFDEPPREVLRRELVWDWNTEDLPVLVAKLSEWDEYGQRVANIVTNPAKLADQISREFLMGRLMSLVLRQHYYQVESRISKGLRELELQEEQNGHAD